MGVLKREEKQQCVRCGAKAKVRPITEHHIKHKALGGPDVPENIEALCSYCHRKEHGERLEIRMKQIAIVRTDINMTPGQLASHVAHGSIEAMMSSSKTAVNRWKFCFYNKAVLQVNSSKKLYDLYRKVVGKHPCSLVHIEGKMFYKSIPTVLVVGPSRVEKLDDIFKDLELLKRLPSEKKELVK